jgi:glycine betaine transporter
MNRKKNVFHFSLVISLLLISVGVFAPKQLEHFFNSALTFIYNYLGWFILGSVFIFFYVLHAYRIIEVRAYKARGR